MRTGRGALGIGVSLTDCVASSHYSCGVLRPQTYGPQGRGWEGVGEAVGNDDGRTPDRNTTPRRTVKADKARDADDDADGLRGEVLFNIWTPGRWSGVVARKIDAGCPRS